MKTRVVHTKIWKDNYTFLLNDREFRVFMFLLFNDQINMIGVYELRDEEIQLWCKIPSEELKDIKLKFEKDKRFVFKDGWVVVLNHGKYNNYGNGLLQRKAFTRELSLVPNNIKQYLNTSIDTDTILDINKKSETINNNTETINNERVEKIKEGIRDRFKFKHD